MAEVFEQLLDLEGEARLEALERSCGGDAELRQAVEHLLAADRQAGAFLDQPAFQLLGEDLSGRRLGPYRLEGPLGSGGMGTVYLARRADAAFEQTVAVKVWHGGPGASSLVRRFLAERQILASLAHPGIVRLLDGGATEEGLPYLVMEHIDGLPIDRYCRQRGLSLVERLELFLRVAAVVASAHRGLVVHRDIKPGNILVSADGEPHLLDFGIAKLLAGSPLGLPEALTTDSRPMTPPYASPEQIEGGAITTATDVYGLGVLLFLLLTWRLPHLYDPDRPGDLERAILEGEPLRASQAALMPATEGAPPEPRAALSRRLRGDLDTLLAQALAREPERRYSSVERFADDVRRYLAGQPITARPPTWSYRLGKFARRHALALALGASALATVLALALVAFLQARRLAEQRDSLARERDTAIRVTRLVEELFDTGDPTVSRGAPISAAEILDRGVAKIDDFANEPAVQTSLALAAGRIYLNLGRMDRAEPLLERALAASDALPIAVRVDIRNSLATLHHGQGDLDRAERELRQVAALLAADPKPPADALAENWNNLGTVLLERGRFEEAQPLLERALAAFRQRYGTASEQVATLLGNLGALAQARHDLPRSEAAFREALGLARQLFGPRHPLVALELQNLAAVLQARDDLAGAAALYRETIELQRQMVAPEHPVLLTTEDNLAIALTLMGRYDEAEALARQVLAAREKGSGDHGDGAAAALSHLGRIAFERGDLAAAGPLFEKALTFQLVSGQGDNPRAVETLTGLGWLRLRQGRVMPARKAADQLLGLSRRLYGEGHPIWADSRTLEGAVLRAEGRLPESRRALEAALARYHEAGLDHHGRRATALLELGRTLEALGHATEAREAFAEAYRVFLDRRGPEARGTREAASALGRP
ncbi:MAG: serine/threonine-protein kinase [Thermoanaerobaculia bacterium]